MHGRSSAADRGQRGPPPGHAAGRRRADQRARLRRDPDRRRGQAGRHQLRAWSSTTSAPATGCSSTRCGSPRRPTTTPRATLLDEESDFRKRLSMLVGVVLRAAAARRGERLVGAVAGPVGDGPAPPRGPRGPRSSSTAGGATSSSGSSPRASRPATSTAGVDLRRFALTFTVVLDGLSTQVALDDKEITSDVAHDIAMEYAEQRLGLAPGKRRVKTAQGARRAAVRQRWSRGAAVAECWFDRSDQHYSPPRPG